MNRTHPKSLARKAKKSYTLSAESVAFLDAMRKRRRAPSVSAVLEEILQMARREQRKAALDRAVSDYYTSLSEAESREQKNWGSFALTQFPDSEG